MEMWKVLLFVVAGYSYWFPMTSTSLYADEESDLKSFVETLESLAEMEAQEIEQIKTVLQQMELEIETQKNNLTVLHNEQTQEKNMLMLKQQEYTQLVNSKQQQQQQRTSSILKKNSSNNKSHKLPINSSQRTGQWTVKNMEQNKNAKAISDVNKLENEITELRKNFSVNHRGKKLHQLERNDWKALEKLANKICEKFDTFSSTAGGVNMKNVLENKAYRVQIGDIPTKNKFQQLSGDIVKKFCTLVQDKFQQLTEDIIKKFCALDKNKLDEILKEVQSVQKAYDGNSPYLLIANSVDEKLKKSFLKIGGLDKDQNTLDMLTRLDCNLSKLDDSSKEKLLTMILNHTNRCGDQLMEGLQLIDIMAILYLKSSGNLSLEERVTAILVHMYKQSMLNRCLVRSGREEVEGYLYLNKYMTPIVFPHMTIPQYIHSTSVGPNYTEGGGDPMRNVDKVLNKINDLEELKGFVVRGNFNGVNIGKEIFCKIALANDPKYKELKRKASKKGLAADKYYCDLIEEYDDPKKIAEAYEYEQKVKYDLVDYCKKKAEELLRKFGYIY